jgi:hypothetical protein
VWLVSAANPPGCLVIDGAVQSVLDYTLPRWLPVQQDHESHQTHLLPKKKIKLLYFFETQDVVIRLQVVKVAPPWLFLKSNGKR